MAEAVNDEEALRVKDEPKRNEAPSSPVQHSSRSETTRTCHQEGNDDGGAPVLTTSQPDPKATTLAEKPYSAFTPREKWGIITLISLASIFSFVYLVFHLCDHLT